VLAYLIGREKRAQNEHGSAEIRNAREIAADLKRNADDIREALIVLKQAGLVTVSDKRIALTQAGREKAREKPWATISKEPFPRKKP